MRSRIRCLASYVRTNTVVYDLCCDHGYIGWTAWDQKALAGLVFVDQSDNALRAVHKALHERSLTLDQRIQIIAAPAEEIHIDERPSDVIIAGVGLHTIVTVIRQLFPKGLGPHRLILSPEKSTTDLRRFLREQNFGLVAEDVVMAAGRFREIIVIEAKGGPIHLMGEGFADRPDPLIQNYLTTLLAWHASMAKKRVNRPDRAKARHYP